MERRIVVVGSPDQIKEMKAKKSSRGSRGSRLRMAKNCGHRPFICSAKKPAIPMKNTAIIDEPPVTSPRRNICVHSQGKPAVRLNSATQMATNSRRPGAGTEPVAVTVY